jgi:MYXO-CTERM domain-containing protein
MVLPASSAERSGGTSAPPVAPHAASLPPTLPSDPRPVAGSHSTVPGVPRLGFQPTRLGTGFSVPAGTPGAPPVLSSVDGQPRPGPGPHPAAGTVPPSNCFGIWPSGWGGQSKYEGSCYGADEPGIDPYSDLPGSGGNVTWHVTLPVDGGSSTWQDDLYSAIWFGLVLDAPGAWLNECFLELQFYPDQNPATGQALDTWDGAAVAWQIDLANGYEDACYYAPLAEDGTSEYLVMHGGDQLNVTLSGWVGDPVGEEIQIHDLTQGNVSTQYLVNFNTGGPLDPAYSTDSYPNALQWTPGGELPVSFAFETGHSVSPYPNNNSYGGCSAGPYPSSLVDPATPCPSYDPGQWVNGTDSPWSIAAPTFFNGAARATATQVDFTQPWGGIAWMDPLSNGTCLGRDGSTYCSYPWYSFNCVSDSFNFGATPYPGAGAEFGATEEFPPSSITDLEQFGFFPPRNNSVPACGEPADTLGVSVSGAAGGSAELLGVATTGSRSYDGLLPGEYSLAAVAPAGSRFDKWTSNGSVAVSDPLDAWSSVTVSGDGNVTAVFSATAPETTLHVHLVGVTGFHGPVLGLEAGLAGAAGPAASLATSSSLSLASGIYTLQGYPPAGYNFSGWSWNGSVDIAGSGLPFTWMTVSTAGAASANLTLEVVATSGTASVYLEFGGTPGAGLVEFDGTFYGSATSLAVPAGTYPVTVYPGAGERWLSTEVYSSSAMQLNVSQTSQVVLEASPTTTTINVTFGQNVSVQLETSGGAGAISWAGAPPVPNGTVETPEEPESGIYDWPVAAVPGADEHFTGWTVSYGPALDALNASSVWTELQVNSSGTLVAHFAPASGTTLGFNLTPTGAGSIVFNFGAPLTSNGTNRSVTPGQYLVELRPGYFDRLLGNSTTGNLSLSAVGPWPGYSILTVGPGGGALTAEFASTLPADRPVTFVSSPSAEFAARVNGTEYRTGDSASLAPGDYSLSAVEIGGCPFASWVTTVNLTASTDPNGSGTLVVNGSGSLYALAAPGCRPLKAVGGVSPDLGDAPLSVTFTSSASGGVAPYTTGWSFGDGTGSSLANTTHTYTEPGTYTANLTLSDPVGQGFEAEYTITVNPAPTVDLTISPASPSAPSVVNLTALVRGGTAPYVYRWEFGDGTTATAGGFESHAYRLAGNYSVNVSILDAVGVGASAQGNFTLNSTVVPPAPLVASLAVNASSIYLGQAIRLAVGATGGTPPYAYAWADLPPGCPDGPGAAVLNCTPTQAGNFTATATVVDSEHRSTNSSAFFEVLPPKKGTPVAPPITAPSSNPWPLILVGGVVVLALIALALLLLRRRRRPVAEEPAPEPNT